MGRSKRKTPDSGGQPGTDRRDRKREKCAASDNGASDSVIAEKNEECVAHLDHSQEGDKGTAGDHVVLTKNIKKRRRPRTADKREGELMVVEEVPVLAEGRDGCPEKNNMKSEFGWVLPDVNKDTEGKEKQTTNGESKSRRTSKSLAKDIAELPSEVSQKDASSSSYSLNTTRVVSVDKNDIEVPNSDSMVLTAKEEGLVITNAEKGDVPLDSNLNSNEENTQKKKRRKKKKKNLCTDPMVCSSSDFTCANSSSMPEIIGSGSVKKTPDETPVISDLASPVKNENTFMAGSVKINRRRSRSVDKQEDELVVKSAEESITTSVYAVVVEEVPVLEEGGDSRLKKNRMKSEFGWESPDANKDTEEGKEKQTPNGESKSRRTSKSLAKEIAELPSEVSQKDASFSSSSNTTHVVSVDKNDSEVPNSDSLVLTAKEEGLVRTNADKGDMPRDTNLNSNEENEQQKKRRRKKKKSPCTDPMIGQSSDATRANSSSVPEIVGSGSVKKTPDETPVIRDLVSPVKNANTFVAGSVKISRRRLRRADKQEGELVAESAEESITTGADAVVVKEVPVLGEGGDSRPKKNRMKSEFGWVSPDVNKDTEEGKEKETPNRESKSRRTSKSRAKEIAELPSEVSQKDASFSSSSNITHAVSVDKNDSEVPNSDSLVLTAKQEGLVITNAEKGDMPLDTNLNSNEENTQKKKRRKKKKKNLCTDPMVRLSSDATCANSSSMPEIVESGSVKKTPGETPVISVLVSPVKKETVVAGSVKISRKRSRRADKQEGELVVEIAEESITTSTDPVVVEEVPVVAEGGDNHPKKNKMKSGFGWVSPDVNKDIEDGKEKQTPKGKCKSRRTSKSLAKDITELRSEVSQKDASFSSSSFKSSSSNTTRVVSVDKNDIEVPNSVSLVLTAKEEGLVRTNADKGDMPPDTNLNSNQEKEHQKKRRKKKKNLNTDPMICPSSVATCAISSSMPEIVESGSVKKTPGETPFISELVSPVKKENTVVAGSVKKTPEETPVIINLVSPVKEEKTVVFRSDNNVTGMLYSDKCSSLLVHRKTHKKKKKKVEDSGLAQTAAANSPNLSDTSAEMTTGSFQLEDPSSSQHKTADKNLLGGLCPSPIRGVVQDLGSADVLNKQSSQLDLFKVEEVSFSFPVAGKVLNSESSASQFEKACQSGGGVASGNGSATVYNESSNGRRGKELTSSSPHSLDVCSSEDTELEAVPVRLDGRVIRSTRKKLLILDLNGILADITNDYHLLRNVRKPHKKVGGKSVFKRPFCDDFLKFCFERFEIGIWSSRRRYNVADIIDYLMGDIKHKLLFSWDQSSCTDTGFRTIENMQKPLVLKELKKLWNKEQSDLPWEKGDYSPSNTLLVDDSPYKAICNPPHTAIFPPPYLFNDENDNSLGPGGDIRVYLEGVAIADDVQRYVQEHPFGQNAITANHPSWKFYQQVIVSAQPNGAVNVAS